MSASQAASKEGFPNISLVISVDIRPNGTYIDLFTSKNSNSLNEPLSVKKNSRNGAENGSLT